MTGYKKIVQNLVEHEVSNVIEKKTGKFPSCPDGATLSIENREFGYPTFEIEMNVPDKSGITKNDYLISGYVSEYGSVVICSITFERRIRKNGEADFHTVREFIHGEALESFNYDR